MKIFSNIKLKILIVALSISIFGCKDSFLDLKDTGSVSSTIFPKSVAQLNQLLASVYGAQHDWGFLGHAYYGYFEYITSHTADLQWRGDPGWNGIALGMIPLNTAQINFGWRDIPRGVYYANSTLQEVATYRKTALETEKQSLDFIEGQALFLRAFFRWHLQVEFGQPDLTGMGIPIINSVPKTIAEMQVPRASTADSYQAMINDFKKASVLLKGQTDKTRATEWSAKAALAKTYFFAVKLDSAKIYLEDCINNSGKTLVSYIAMKNMFNGNIQYEYNSESFYETANSDDPSGASNSRGATIGSDVSLLFTAFYVNPSDGERKAMGYSNLYMHDQNVLRFGYTDPPLLTQVEEVGGVWKLKDAYVAQQKVRRANIGREPGGPDPRLWICGFQPMFDTLMVSGVWYKAGQGEFGKWWKVDPATNLNPLTFYGWCLKKNQYLGGAINEMKQVIGANQYFIRLPDIYLMYAEILKSTNPALALEYINKVHRRAYNYDPNVASPVDYASLTARTVAPAGDHLANNPLLYERWAEFFGEARWWEQVKRLKIGPQESAFFKTASAGKPIVWRDEHYAMPLPTIEFEGNSNPGMKQNPGY